jgi:hypothetical protein
MTALRLDDAMLREGGFETAGVLELSVTVRDAASAPLLVAALSRMRLERLWMSVPDGQKVTLAGDVLASPALASLQSLWITNVTDARAVLHAIASAPHFASLVSLTLVAFVTDDGGLEELARARHLASLRDLDLRPLNLWPTEMPQQRRRGWAFSWAGVLALVESPFLALSRLRIAGHGLGPGAELDRFLAAPGVARLKHLAIGGNAFDGEAIRKLAASPALAGLESLGMGETAIDAAGLEALLTSPYLSRELEIELDGGVLGLTAQSSIDGVSGLVSETWWTGDPPARVAERFRVRTVGRPDR